MFSVTATAATTVPGTSGMFYFISFYIYKFI